MNAREFYEKFKAALDFVGVGFAGMDTATIAVVDGQIIVTYAGASAIFVVAGGAQ